MNIQGGLCKIAPHRTDYSLLHTFGATTEGLPFSFSIYDGSTIPNQNDFDERFAPAVRPLSMGCTAETTTFIAGIEDGAVYRPDDFYFATPPGTDGQGRDLREALKTAQTVGFTRVDGVKGFKKGDYYNCYGAGEIDDFNAARIALWINQQEKRGVSVGSWWYPEWSKTLAGGILPTPSFNTKTASLHNWLIVGWEGDYLIAIPWLGHTYGNNGTMKIHRTLYNALMAQPYTAAFTLATTPPTGAVSIGLVAIIDHLVYFIRSLFKL